MGQEGRSGAGSRGLETQLSPSASHYSCRAHGERGKGTFLTAPTPSKGHNKDQQRPAAKAQHTAVARCLLIQTGRPSTPSLDGRPTGLSPAWLTTGYQRKEHPPSMSHAQVHRALGVSLNRRGRDVRMRAAAWEGSTQVGFSIVGPHSQLAREFGQVRDQRSHQGSSHSPISASASVFFSPVWEGGSSPTRPRTQLWDRGTVPLGYSPS